MDMIEKLKAAGVNVPQPPQKIKSKKVNLKMKVDAAEKFLTNAIKAVDRLNSSPDEDEFWETHSTVTLNYQRFCEAIKDILDRIATKENITGLSSNRGLRELIRHTASILDITKNVEDSAKTLVDRNDEVHDYMNSDYYDELVVNHIVNHQKQYSAYLEAIKQYFRDNV